MNPLTSLNGRQFKSISNEDIFEQNLFTINMLRQFIEKSDKTYTIYKKTFEEVSKNEKISEIKKRLLPHVQNLENCLEEVTDLIFELGAIMKICQQIIDLIEDNDQENKYLLRLAIIIHDLIKKVKAERFKAEEIGLVKDSIEKIISSTVTREDVIQIDLKLMNKGLNWVIGG